MVNNSPAKAGDVGSLPGLGRSPGEGNGYPLQYSWLENSRDRGAWQATGHGVTHESDTTERTTTLVVNTKVGWFLLNEGVDGVGQALASFGLSSALHFTATVGR